MVSSAYRRHSNTNPILSILICGSTSWWFHNRNCFPFSHYSMRRWWFLQLLLRQTKILARKSSIQLSCICSLRLLGFSWLDCFLNYLLLRRDQNWNCSFQDNRLVRPKQHDNFLTPLRINFTSMRLVRVLAIRLCLHLLSWYTWTKTRISFCDRDSMEQRDPLDLYLPLLRFTLD